MTIRRRDFMKILSASGIAVTSPFYATQQAAAAEPDRFFAFVSAGGGWDVTSCMDPKGNIDGSGKGNVNKYNRNAIKEQGNFKYAPWMGEGEDPGSYDRFFGTYMNELVVVNGIDMETNGHSTGRRKVWSGDGSALLPCTAALIAACNHPDIPLSFISNGYFDGTSGLIPKTRVSRLDNVYSLALPNRQSVNNNNKYHHDAIEDIVKRKENARLQALMNETRLPEKRAQMAQLFASRQTAGEIERIVEKVPDEISRNSLNRQAQIACAAFSAGVASTANLSMGGFDTHDNNDNRAYRSISQIIDGVDYLMKEAERQGIRDKLTVVVGSDFGRRPFYNNRDGKDHWPVGSMLVLGAGVNGNRTVGATTNGLKARKINPNTLAVVENGGVTITHREIIRSLRQLAGIDNHPIAQSFDVGGRALNLFG